MQSLQPTLFQDDSKRQAIIQDIDPSDCVISRFNTRKTRQEKDVERLAERMQRNGFELTRALWAYENGHGEYEIFAGGTRLEAARLAGVNVALILHEGYSEQEIARLEQQDNENDEYHREVPITDVWAEYARLSVEEEWTHKQIANTKGDERTQVGRRIKWHKELPDEIKRGVDQRILTERHLIEITAVWIDPHFSPWLTIEQVWLELTEWAVGKTTRTTRDKAKDWDAFIEYADVVYQDLGTITLHDISGESAESYEWDAASAFVEDLANRKARSMAEVKAAENAIHQRIDSNWRLYRDYVETQSVKAARGAERTRREQALLARFHHGDAREWIPQIEGPIHLVLTDPPYGKDFQSNRRTASPKAPKLAGDESATAATELLAEALTLLEPKMADDSHLVVFTSIEHECLFRQTIAKAGFTIKGGPIWVKENHTSGDLEGSFAPRHERMIHAVKGSPKVSPRIDDVLQVSREYRTDHPTEKPIELLLPIIESTTEANDLVVDPFAGVGSTAIACLRSERQFQVCDLSEDWWREGVNELLKELDDVDSK